jgi:hypothetical protein
VKEVKRVWKEGCKNRYCLLVVIGFQESERWRQKECLTRDRRHDQVLRRPFIFVSIWVCVCVSADGSWSLGAICGRESGRLCPRVHSKVNSN